MPLARKIIHGLVREQTSELEGAVKDRPSSRQQLSIYQHQLGKPLQYFDNHLNKKPVKPLRRGEESKIVLTGKHTYGVDNIKIRSWGEGAHLFIGSFCSIAGQQTIFLGGNHRTDWATTFPFGHIFNEEFPAGEINGKGHPSTKGHVIIENDVWIGAGCTIMSGLKIGSGSVIATKSVVVKDVEPYTIVGGNPAKPIKQRFPKHIAEELLRIEWWEKDDAQINKIVPLLQAPLTEEVLAKIISALNKKPE